MLRADIGAIKKRFAPSIWADPDVVPYAAKVSVWGRWFVLLVTVFQFVYRPEFWYPDNLEYTLPPTAMLALNGLVHYRLLTNRPVTWHWLLLLSGLDFVLITADIVIGGGFKSFTYLAYYPALAMFAAVFTSGQTLRSTRAPIITPPAAPGSRGLPPRRPAGRCAQPRSRVPACS